MLTSLIGSEGYVPDPRRDRAGLRVRADVVRVVLPPRGTNRLGVSPRNRTYPGYAEGYRPADLGAPSIRRQA
ncbi:hypothetical protein [Dactylosporangium sp. CA-139066]|uniref:hypothetical protein n=1 Tax=Dactylosporangium sp. CA-139066 TaxID=3239930 RepID=UPI003D8D4738